MPIRAFSTSLGELKSMTTGFKPKIAWQLPQKNSQIIECQVSSKLP